MRDTHVVVFDRDDASHLNHVARKLVLLEAANPYVGNR